MIIIFASYVIFDIIGSVALAITPTYAFQSFD
jgi:hypothetical protein